MKNEIHEMANTTGILSGAVCAVTGIAYQGLAAYDKALYQPLLAGHLGDYGAALVMSCWYNKDHSESILNHIWKCAGIATGWTGFEFMQKAGYWPGTHDTGDIWAFWLGSATAACISILAKPRNKTYL